jgi:hypothetical protein
MIKIQHVNDHDRYPAGTASAQATPNVAAMTPFTSP